MTHTALILDFRLGEERRRDTPRHLDVSAALERVSMAMDWLADNGVEILGFGCNGRGPLVAVLARPAVYKLFGPLAETLRRSESVTLWQAQTADGVRVLWEEPTCAS